MEQICSLAIPDRNQQTDDRRTLLREFRDVLAMNDNELAQTHLVQHAIDTGDTLPIKLAPHRLAPGKITVVKKEIEDMLARNIILFQESVTYLGYNLSPGGIAPDENKLVAVRDWKRPENVTEVRSFIGFCSYYRRFIKDFAGIAKPLHQITKKNCCFTWNPECHNAFKKLKDALIGSSVLKHPDYNSPFIVETDASDNSLGAVLSNIVDGIEHPVAFASRVLTPVEFSYSTTKREALAVIQAMKWFKPYIWGTHFVLRTDHASLQWLFRQNNDGMIFKMLQRLQEIDFQVVHRPGDKHGNADGLSRQCTITPELAEAERLVMFGSSPQLTLWKTPSEELT